MKFYKVEMDGFSNVASLFELEEGVACKVSGRETGFYRIRKVEDGKVMFSALKYVEPTTEVTKSVYEYDGDNYHFDNRLSKNQTISINGRLYKVLNIVDKTKLELEEILYRNVIALYPVYEAGAQRKISLAEEIFTEWGEAYGYVLQERSKGRKVSL